jgi:DNA-binding CsgD family transcriptional regulator
MDTLAFFQRLESEGLSEKEIADYIGSSVEDVRGWKSAAKARKQAADAAQALRWKDKGMSNVAIGERLGVNESTVRSLLGEATAARLRLRENTVDFLRQQVAKKGYVDVGIGTELYMGVSKSQKQQALYDLEHEGYLVTNIKIPQIATGKNTDMLVLASPGTEWKDVAQNKDHIRTVAGWTEDGGRTFQTLVPPRTVAESRIQVAYKEQGGSDKDGVLEIRRGVDDLYMGNAQYMQVRVLTDQDHYLKGMAVYADDLPPGVDIRFNSNKPLGTPINEVFKPVKSDDPLQPWEGSHKQKKYIDGEGNEQVSALNHINEEGDWNEWSRTISSQMLSKQPVALVERQLGQRYDQKISEFEELSSLTNPVIRKKLMEAAAESFDESAVSLKAAAFPRQNNSVILPFPSMKETEIYAPLFKDGERVVLIRHPHGGIFEIPELTVNNKNADAIRVLGKHPSDAVGINPKVAQQLSGADFDGDTVLVIPNPRGEIKTSSPLAGLKTFDPKVSYPRYEGMIPMTKEAKQAQMGKISNLITDMTIKGASQEEIARAVRHSMVVIDAEKHKLNWRQSEIDNGIIELKKRYQGGANRGASTIISRASSDLYVPHIKRLSVNPETGELEPVFSGAQRAIKVVNKRTGEVTWKEGPRTTKTKTMMFYPDGTPRSDAFTLSSGTDVETVYATYANQMKALANETRRVALTGTPVSFSPSAAKVYATEVASLNQKLQKAQMNKPLERQAQVLANTAIRAKRQAAPDMDDDQLKKVRNQELAKARAITGASRSAVHVSDKEWEAIQAGAINVTKLRSIMEVADTDRLRQLATPRKSTSSSVSASRVRALLAAGLTQAQVAAKLGISTSTVNKLANA